MMSAEELKGGSLNTAEDNIKDKLKYHYCHADILFFTIKSLIFNVSAVNRKVTQYCALPPINQALLFFTTQDLT